MNTENPSPPATAEEIAIANAMLRLVETKNDDCSVTLSINIHSAVALVRDLVKRETATLRQQQPVNTHVRLFDLVRYMRAELHKADLITDQEYVWLCTEAPMAKGAGSPSPRRLEDYDVLKSELEDAKAKIKALRGALEYVQPYCTAKHGVPTDVEDVFNAVLAPSESNLTFTQSFHGGYGEPFPLKELAAVLVDTDWDWMRNNRAKHLVVFIDTRGERMCRVYDREQVVMTLTELKQQVGRESQ
jgi:hypothetical protein